MSLAGAISKYKGKAIGSKSGDAQDLLHVSRGFIHHLLFSDSKLNWNYTQELTIFKHNSANLITTTHTKNITETVFKGIDGKFKEDPNTGLLLFEPN